MNLRNKVVMIFGTEVWNLSKITSNAGGLPMDQAIQNDIDSALNYTFTGWIQSTNQEN